MLLRYSLNQDQAASAIEAAVAQALDANILTGDLLTPEQKAQGIKAVSTSEMGDHICQFISQIS
ncbi:3-isopropylmalate dehydrogenase [compost metagenome]